jgi:hypothetical protein
MVEIPVRIAMRLLTVALLAVTVAAQRSSSFQELAAPLAAKVAAALAPGDQVILTMAAADNDNAAALLPVEAEIRRALAARTVRTIESGAGLELRVGCSTNLRERACIAEFHRGDARDVIIVSRPLETGSDRPASLSLELTPIFSQRAPILDVALAGNRLLVLDPERITWYEQTPLETDRLAGRSRADEPTPPHWTSRRAAAIGRSRPWPRDARGRLRSDETTVTAWLPGVSCRGSIDLSRLVCGENRGESWPIGIDNTGMDAARNYFNTPQGLPFYAGAPLDAEAGARGIVASTDGGLLFLDDGRRTAAAGTPADDVAALDAACPSGGGHLLVASTTGFADLRDSLRLLRATKRRLIAVSSPVELPGRLTALWSTPGSNVATAVVHDQAAGRYEAFQVRAGCPEL